MKLSPREKERWRRMLLYVEYILFLMKKDIIPEGYSEMTEERMLKWFAYEHLPPHLQDTSKPFGELAKQIVESIDSGPERTVALRKLLESKDAAVRAKLNPGS
jgi:hypothetical protein